MAKKNGQEVTLAEKIALTKTEALIHAESFYHYKLIARASGISDDQLKRYREDDTAFADSLEQARTRFLNKNMRRAKPEFLLERLEPELFKQRTESDTNITLPTPILGGLSVRRDDSDTQDTKSS